MPLPTVTPLRPTRYGRTPDCSTFFVILIADDQPDILEAMRLLLKGAGYAAETALSPEHAMRAASRREHDLILIDMNYARDTTSGSEGLALLEMLRAQRPQVPVVVMTAWSTVDLAVDAMRRGAADFITKPWDNGRVLEVVARQASRQNELSIAQRVQRKLLPPPHLSLPGLECECVFRPAGEVGGDLCDIFQTGPDTSAFLLGDITGKGTGAALLMANLLGIIRSNQDLATRPAFLTGKANSQFFASTTPEHFATLFFGSWNQSTGLLRYVNCGHPAPVLRRRDGGIERLLATGLMLGAFDGIEFGEQTVVIYPGDRLVLFSDGVSEARADEDDQWVGEVIGAAARSGVDSVARTLALAAAESTDDVTVLELRFLF